VSEGGRYEIGRESGERERETKKGIGAKRETER